MLSKNTDIALVGHNFFSYLMGIGLLSKKKSVLILDDTRFNHGSLLTDSLTILDLEILKKWGDKYDVPTLKKMEEYIQFSPISFFVGKTEVLLGHNPYRNYTELARKFPEFFPDSNLTLNFDQSVYQVAQCLADAFYSDKNIIEIPKLLINFKTLEVMKKFDEFYALFLKKDKWDIDKLGALNSFVSLSRGFFHNRLSINGSRSELMHLFFSILSPRFKFDHAKFSEDLQTHFKSIGGEFKKLNIAAMKMQRGLVTSFELESFEGIISPTHLLFLGGEPTGLPIILKEKVNAYNAMEIKLHLKEPIANFLVDKRIFFSSPMKTGTTWPFWEACFHHDYIVFKVVMIRRQGIKEDFIADKVIKYLLDDLEYIYPEQQFQVVSSFLKFTFDVLIEDNNVNAHLKELPKTKFRPIKVYSKITPFSFLRLRNVSYLGPYSGTHYGVFSSLIQLQKSMESL